LHSILFGNEERVSTPKDTQTVKLGTGVLFDDPRVDANYQHSQPIEGDPDVRAVDGGKSRVGLGPVAGCAELHES
jgi:hypothetical protein